MASKRIWLRILLQVGAATVIAAIFWRYYTNTHGPRGANQGVKFKFDLPVSAGDAAENRIAFVGRDLNIWSVSPDGSSRRQHTGISGKYSLPTWAPDGRRLAFIGELSPREIGLYLSTSDGGVTTLLAMSPASNPFYLYWSPASDTIAYLAQEESGPILRIVELADPKSNRSLGGGFPYFWNWAPDGSQLLVHDQDKLYVIENLVEPAPIPIDEASLRFQTPLWSMDGESVYYVTSDGDGASAIFRSSTDSHASRRLSDASAFTRMILSADGSRLACLMAVQNVPARFGQAVLIDPSTGERRAIADELISAMFWSPDGTKLALFGPIQESSATEFFLGGTEDETEIPAVLRGQTYLACWVHDTKDASTIRVASFIPTSQFLTVIPFFDQYHLSHTFWSPDSRYLVIPSRQRTIRAASIWIVDSTGEEEAKQVAEGLFAVWSWN